MSAPTFTTSSYVRPQPTSCVVGSDDLVVPSGDGPALWAPGTNVVGIAGNDVNNEAFKACCKGPVNFAPPCALWCEVQPRPFILSELDECWKSHGLTVNAQFGQLQMVGTNGQGVQLASTSSVPGYPATDGYETAAYSVATTTLYNTASTPTATETYHVYSTANATSIISSGVYPTSTTTAVPGTTHVSGSASASASSSTSVHHSSTTTTTATTTAAQSTIPVAAGNSLSVNFGVATAALVMVIKHLLF